MKIESYEKLMESVKSHEVKQQADNEKRAAAAAEVEAAKVSLNALLDRALSSTEDLSEEVGRAQGRVMITEEKQRRLLGQLGNPNTSPNLNGIDLHRVTSEIRTQIQDGRLLEDLQPDLDELNNLREQYREKLKTVLVKRAQLNKQLAAIQYDTKNLVEKATGKSQSFGSGGPVQLGVDELRNWIWVYDDLASETRHIEKEFDGEVNGPLYMPKGFTPNVVVLRSEGTTVEQQIPRVWRKQ